MTCERRGTKWRVCQREQATVPIVFVWLGSAFVSSCSSTSFQNILLTFFDSSIWKRWHKEIESFHNHLHWRVYVNTTVTSKLTISLKSNWWFLSPVIKGGLYISFFLSFLLPFYLMVLQTHTNLATNCHSNVIECGWRSV